MAQYFSTKLQGSDELLSHSNSSSKFSLSKKTKKKMGKLQTFIKKTGSYVKPDPMISYGFFI